MDLKKRMIAVCASWKHYAEALADYMNERAGRDLEVHSYTKTESLRADAAAAPPDTLLISEMLYSEDLGSLGIRTLVLLTEEPPESAPEDEPAAERDPAGPFPGGVLRLYRYLPADRLLEQMLSFLARTAPERPQAGRSPSSGSVKVIGVYSPVGRCGKTLFCLALGMAIARKRRCLYLNAENYSGFRELTAQGTHPDLSDLVYYARTGGGDMRLRLGSMIVRAGSLDYLPPMFSPEDVRSVRAAEWENLIGSVLGGYGYEYVVWDIGSQVEDVFSLLKMCRRVYVPVLDDVVSQAKLQQFRQNMELMLPEEVRENVKTIRVPRAADSALRDFPAGLSEGRLGAFARQVAEAENDV